MPKEPSIFINYRRKLSDSSANLLYLMLEQRFPGEVFMDLDLEGGDIWDPEIEARLDPKTLQVVEMEYDDDDVRHRPRNPAAATTARPPQNGLFGTGTAPRVQVN